MTDNCVFLATETDRYGGDSIREAVAPNGFDE